MKTCIDESRCHVLAVKQVGRLLSLETKCHFEFDGTGPIAIAGLVGSTLDRLPDCRQSDPLPNDLGRTEMLGGKSASGISTRV